ncbi:MAG: metal-sensitive transcriptional regulator [Armatimonadetes bacterium]|nr:metal-sensitive transcriptional regulator [Armatimonadota bacterium]
MARRTGRPLIQDSELVLIDNARKEELLRRLSRIEGQVRGLKGMVAEGRPCMDILTQIASAHEALRGVGKIMVRNYLEKCATSAIRSGDPEESERVYRELVDLLYKYAR